MYEYSSEDYTFAVSVWKGGCVSISAVPSLWFLVCLKSLQHAKCISERDLLRQLYANNNTIAITFKGAV